LKRINNFNKAYLNKQIKTKYNQIPPEKDRAGLIRRTKNLSLPPAEESNMKKKKRNSSSLPNLANRKVPEDKMINIFDQGIMHASSLVMIDHPSTLNNKITTLAQNLERNNVDSMQKDDLSIPPSPSSTKSVVLARPTSLVQMRARKEKIR
jgi:hypothetical protein